MEHNDITIPNVSASKNGTEKYRKQKHRIEKRNR